MTPGLMGVKGHPFKVRGLNRPRAGPSPPRSPASLNPRASAPSHPSPQLPGPTGMSESSSGKGQDKGEDGPVQF